MAVCVNELKKTKKTSKTFKISNETEKSILCADFDVTKMSNVIQNI